VQIATILPTEYLWLEDGNSYHLTLAHQVKKSLADAFFFRRQARNGAFVICDNGAAEYGVPMGIDELLPVVKMIGCQELVLPDTIYDTEATLGLSHEALMRAYEEMPDLHLMAVPHGKSAWEWISCAREMLLWGIDTIGISKFIVPSLFTSRVEAIRALPELIYNTRYIDIHLLGYTGVKGEIAEIERLFSGRVRGIDSSLPTLYTQIGQELRDERPNIKLDLDAEVDEKLLKKNIQRWKELCKWT
jgi:hypothetical protein